METVTPCAVPAKPAVEEFFPLWSAEPECRTGRDLESIGGGRDFPASWSPVTAACTWLDGTTRACAPVVP